MAAPTAQPVGPISEAVAQRPPFGAMGRLDREALMVEQQRVLGSSRRKYSLSARALFSAMDLVYGKERTLEKFRVIEVVARMPYQAWESVAYVAMTHVSKTPDLAKRIHERARVARFEQDNEQWHLLILEELTNESRRTWIRGHIIPQILAMVYYQLSWLMYALRPKWSYRLNADFEDHASHEYANLVAENPEYETTPFVSQFETDYGSFDSLADLFRQIGYDEVVHRIESELMMNKPRYS